MRSIILAGVVQAKRETVFLGYVFGIVVVFGLFVVQPLQRLYDQHLRPTPWIEADLLVLPALEDSGLRIRYGVQAHVVVKGTWTAWLQLASDPTEQVCNGQGNGSYSPATPRYRNWNLDYFLGSPTPCAVPKTPFRACVKYEVVTANGAAAGFGPFCSPVFDPRGTKQ